MPMGNKQKTLSLIGLVIIVPNGSALTPSTAASVSSGGSRKPSTAIILSERTKPSRRAFLVTTSTAALGILDARPVNAATRLSRPISFGYLKRRGKWQRIGGGGGGAGGESESSDDEEELDSSDNSSDCSSNDDSDSCSSSDDDRE